MSHFNSIAFLFLFLISSPAQGLFAGCFDQAEAEFPMREGEPPAYVYSVTSKTHWESDRWSDNEMWYVLGDREWRLEALWWVDPHFEAGDLVAVWTGEELDDDQQPTELSFFPVFKNEEGNLERGYGLCIGKRWSDRIYKAR